MTRVQIGRACVTAALGLLMVAGLLKLLDLEQFQQDVSAWQMIPRPLVLPITLGLPPLEVLVGGLWLLGFRSVVLPLSGMSLYSAFIGLVVVHAAVGEPPHCGCFGLIDEYFRHLDGGVSTAFRAGGLMVLCSAGTVLSWKGVPSG